MSPAPSEGDDDIHSWVGIIMYLPDEATRGAITKRFWEYNGMCRERLWSKFGAHQHWAKIELPDDAAAATTVRRRLAERFVDALSARGARSTRTTSSPTTSSTASATRASVRSAEGGVSFGESRLLLTKRVATLSRSH